MYDSERFRSASLIGAVICNSHHGMKCIDDIIFTGDIQSVVGGKVECQAANPIDRANQSVFFSPGQVSQIDHSELSERNQQAHGLRVFRSINSGPELALCRAVGIALASAWNRLVDDVACRAQNL